MRKMRRGAILAALSALALVLSTGASGSKETYRGVVVTVPDGSMAPPQMVTVSIHSWTTDQEAQVLRAALKNGTAATDKSLWKNNKGNISLIGSLGWPIGAARSYPNGTGQRIVVVCDRPIGFAEAETGSATMNYPFGIVMLDVDAAGKGTGKIIGAARISLDETGKIDVDPYSGLSMELNRVERLK